MWNTAIQQRLLANHNVLWSFSTGGLLLALFADPVAKNLGAFSTQIRSIGFTLAILSSTILGALNWRLIFIRSRIAAADSIQKNQAFRNEEIAAEARVQELLAARTEILP